MTPRGSFMWAMEKAALSIVVRRKGWLDVEQLQLARDPHFSVSTFIKVCRTEYGISHRRYTPTVVDMFSQDWELVE